MSDKATPETETKPVKDAEPVKETKTEKVKEPTHVRLNIEGGHVGGVMPGNQKFRIVEGRTYPIDIFDPQILSAFVTEGILVLV